MRIPQVEAALVAVRVPAHYVLTKNALEAGKHVYCEWPLGRKHEEAEELAALARKIKVRTMVGLQRRASPAYMCMRELVQEGYVGKVLSVNMTHMGEWRADPHVGPHLAARLQPGREHTNDHVRTRDGRGVHGRRRAGRSVRPSSARRCRSGSRPTPKNTWTSTSPDNIMVTGRLEGGAVVSANFGVHPYHGSGYRFEIYGTEGTLAMVGGGEAGEEAKRKIMGGHKEDKALQELPYRSASSGCRKTCAAWSRLRRGPDVGQVCRGDPHRHGIETDFDHAVRRHRTLDAIVRASETGQRQKIVL